MKMKEEIFKFSMNDILRVFMSNMCFSVEHVTFVWLPRIRRLRVETASSPLDALLLMGLCQTCFIKSKSNLSNGVKLVYSSYKSKQKLIHYFSAELMIFIRWGLIESPDSSLMTGVLKLVY